MYDNQVEVMTKKLFEERQQLEYEDERMNEKLDFMYHSLDYDYDRHRVRDKFLQECNKRTTLADIGETLDKLVIDSKAAMWKYYHLGTDHDKQPARASKDYSSVDFKWSGKLLRTMDPKTPLWIDDENQMYQQEEGNIGMHQKVRDFVKYNDEHRDYSYGALSKDEKNEIALFHSMKQDPWFKHYIYNHLRKYAEDEDEINLGFPNSSIEKLDIYDHTKFDKLNLFDFRRNLPMKARESKVDSFMRAYGYGKRKRSRALVYVEPGKGEVKVNGKPLLQSLFLPMQR